jgi:hypothetical protein
VTAIHRDIVIEQGATFDLAHTHEAYVVATNGAMTADSAVLTAGLSFTAGDVGRSILVAGVDRDGNDLKTTVLSVQSGTQVTLSKPARLSVASAKVSITRPVDLTGASGRMQVRRDHAAATKLLDVPAVTGTVTLGGTAGTIAVSVPPASTSALPIGDAVYDIEVQFASGRVERVLQGRVRISPEATR